MCRLVIQYAGCNALQEGSKDAIYQAEVVQEVCACSRDRQQLTTLWPGYTARALTDSKCEIRCTRMLDVLRH